ncbi:MAG: SH3 domain-containing protein [Lachnospiraceae bacterium]|nr:SH3 domain-containing protein [Lachnospiraceae bacterium]
MTAWAVPASGTAVSDNIVVRESAVSGAQVGGLSEGQAVSIEDETTGSDGNTWYQVSYTVDGVERSGWVRGDLLETSDENLDEDSDAEETDEEGENVSLEFTTQNGSITLTDIPEAELSLVSDRFAETSLAFEEATVTALQLTEPDELVADDAAIVDFYYVYGYNEIGKTGWYVYNADDGTIQKNILNMQYSVTETAADETETESDFSTDSLTKMAFSVLAVVGLLLLILTIIFSVRYRRLRRILEEELEEDEELAQKKTVADPRQKSDSGERDRVKIKKKPEKPEPVKVGKGAARPDGEETGDRMAAKQLKADAKAETGQQSEQTAEGYAGEAGSGRRGKASHTKKMKKENAPVQEALAPGPMSEIGGIDVMDLDSMDDLDFEALLNRYIEEDMASETDVTAGESAGVRGEELMPETGIQKDDPARDAVKQEAGMVRKAPTKEDSPAQDAVKKETSAARKASRLREEEIAAEWLDDYDIPIEKGADYDIPASDESDIIDLSKLKLPGDEPEYYDDDEDLEFL